MTTANRGYITVATRHRRYLEMAVDMALSLREHNPDPISIVVDKQMQRILDRHYAGIFDQVILLPTRYELGRARKYYVARATPYAYTFFLDADAFILGSMTPLWLSARGCSVGLVGEMVQGETDQAHHDFLISDLMHEFELDGYLKNNSSLFYFEKKAGMQFLDDCFELYRDQIYTPTRRAQGWIGDELALAIVGGRAGVNLCHIPAPFYWANELAERTPTDLHRPMITFLDIASQEVIDWLVANARRRRREAGVRDITPIHWWIESQLNGSWSHWLPRGSQRYKMALRIMNYFSG
ncbi:MAG: hypothetical protein KAZ38_06725 [Caldilineaceae bacterium]|nr:hypothetical protein [Caldilineaceae bacterium]